MEIGRGKHSAVPPKFRRENHDRHLMTVTWSYVLDYALARREDLTESAPKGNA